MSALIIQSDAIPRHEPPNKNCFITEPFFNRLWNQAGLVSGR